MLQALIITLREGVEAALIVGIVISCLNKIGRQDLNRVVYAGLFSALLGSVVAAIALSRFTFNQEAFEGVVMLVASFFVVSMIVFMARAARTLKGDIEQRVNAFAGRGAVLGLFLFVFLLVLREGAETVLVLSAVSLTSDSLFAFLGTLAGVSLSFLFGVMFIRGSVRIDFRKFFKVTTVILIFVAIQLLISGLHELSEAGILPSSKRTMALIGPVVRNEIFFFVTILALAALMVLFESRSRVPSMPEASSAEIRKLKWAARRERLWSSAVYVSSFIFILLVTAQFIYAKSTTELSPATPISFVNGKVVLDAAILPIGGLQRYSADVNGRPVRFLLYRKPDGAIVSLMDACSICGGVGFYRSPHGLTCKNCNAPINPESVGDSGGCNPIPLHAETIGNTVTLLESDILHGASQVKE